MEELETHHASAERQGPEVLSNQRELLLSLPCLKTVLSKLPYISFVINKDRQVLIANKNFQDMLGIDSDDPIIGKRPGEIVNCIHAKRSKGGCGTSTNCQFCDAVNAVLDSQNSGKTEQREARLVTDQDGTDVHFDLMVTSSPLEIKDEYYYMVTMVDITSEKRRRVMERVFFHDVMNTTQGLLGAIEFMEEAQSQEQMKKMLDTSRMIADQLIDEISFQKDILAAETGDLVLNPEQVLSTDILEDVIRSLLNLNCAKGKTMVVERNAEIFTLEVDNGIVKRVLINMAKNALEASKEGDRVIFNCAMVNDSTVFTVWNKAVIPEDVQAQLWQRSYSTKGKNRGIGTYSMKMFAENYLKGKVTFESEEGKGTTFKLVL
jgi:K+-sensing histidine kinase KdpD